MIRTLGGMILWLEDNDVDVNPEVLMKLVDDDVGGAKGERERIQELIDLLKGLALEEEAEFFKRTLTETLDSKTLSN